MAIIFLFVLLAGFQTPLKAEADWIASVSAKIDGPTADQVWPYIADFCNLYKIYLSDASFCVSGTDGQPGLTRYIVEKFSTPSDPKTFVVKWLREELLEFNAKERFETHIVRANNKGFTKFIATVQILPDGDTGCTFKWSVVTAPIAGLTYEDFVGKLEENLAALVSLIQNLL